MAKEKDNDIKEIAITLGCDKGELYNDYLYYCVKESVLDRTRIKIFDIEEKLKNLNPSCEEDLLALRCLYLELKDMECAQIYQTALKRGLAEGYKRGIEEKKK